MLRHAFRFLPRIGRATEESLWRRGVGTWEEYRTCEVIPRVPAKLKADHDRLLAFAEEALARRDGAFFHRRLPAEETWRCWKGFGDAAVFLDIETDPADGVTVVGMARAGRAPVALVQGEDLSTEAVEAHLAEASMLVTFNGASFDLPVLARAGIRIPAVPHLDLRIALRRIGLTGGLKRIERTLGLARDDDLVGVDGWEAVRLWRRHVSGDPDALDILVRYNIADVVNLVPLAKHAYRELAAKQREKLVAQTRLIPAAPTPTSTPPPATAVSPISVERANALK